MDSIYIKKAITVAERPTFITKMTRYDTHLDWIDAQHDRMCECVASWAGVNSGTRHLAGLKTLTGMLTEAFGVLGGEAYLIDLPPFQSVDSAGKVERVPLAPVIQIKKRPAAPLRVFLGIHMDTVYPADHPFQTVERINAQTLRGPGVADAKGGLVVMLTALEALERSGLADTLGWEVLVNTDEEIGSPGSASLLAQCAKRNHLGMVFEPTHPDGTLIGARGGSGNFTAVIHGKAAHVGRAFEQGRSAIDAMAQMITSLTSLNATVPGAVVNVGRVEGGGPVNVVPDLAICRWNIRIADRSAQAVMDQHMERIVGQAAQRDGISVDLHGGWTSPPKPMDEPTQELFHHVAACGQELGMKIRWHPTGGVCDGNKLAAAGLPTVDTLGPRGGSIHSSDEYLLLDSLTERAKLSALLLMKLATGELAWHPAACPVLDTDRDTP